MFARLAALATTLAAERRYDAAVLFAEMAAHWACQNHPGFFVSRDLERLLLQIGRTLTATGPNLPVRSRREPGADGRERVLHVVTEAYAVGGHTRVIWRWVRMDSTRSHDLALTHPWHSRLPAPLTEAVARSNGEVYDLSSAAKSPLTRARYLRSLASTADFVVHHTHPFDAIPLLAFADPVGRPKTILANHAGHKFWLGVSISDIVASYREITQRLCCQRRGVAQQRSLVLPLPIETETRALSRSEAKRRLGIPTSAVVCLSVASPDKFETDSNDHFVSVLSPVLEEAEGACLLAIGPRNIGTWKEGHVATKGCIMPLGERADLSVFYQAADIYIDSFPRASPTARLEAGSYGTPIVSLMAEGYGHELIQLDEPGLPIIRAPDVDPFRDTLARLIADEGRRRRLGDKTASTIRATRVGDGWTRQLQGLYDHARGVDAIEGPTANADASEIDRIDIVLSNNIGNEPDSIERLVGYHLNELGFLDKVLYWWRYCSDFSRFTLRYMIFSESTIRSLGRFKRNPFSFLRSARNGN